MTLLTRFSKTSMSMLRELASQTLLAAVVFGAEYYYGSKDEREVYKNICMDDDGVKIFNTYIGAKE